MASASNAFLSLSSHEGNFCQTMEKNSDCLQTLFVELGLELWLLDKGAKISIQFLQCIILIILATIWCGNNFGEDS